MAITVASQTTSNSASATSLTLTLSSHTTDDIIACFVGWECNGDTGTAITESANGGFTRVFNVLHTTERDRRTAFFWKRATSASETDPQFDFDGGANQCAVTGVVLSGCTTVGSPLDVAYVEGTHSSDTADTINVTNPAITTGTDGAMVLLLYYGTHNEITGSGAPTNYSVSSEVTANNGNNYIATRTITSATTETPGAWAHTGTSSETDVSAHTIAIAPAGSVTTAPTWYYNLIQRRRSRY